MLTLQKTNEFGFVQPFLSIVEDLKEGSTNKKIAIPEDLSTKNLLIEVGDQKSGLKQLQTYFSAILRVRLFENYGELKVFIVNDDGQDEP